MKLSFPRAVCAAFALHAATAFAQAPAAQPSGAMPAAPAASTTSAASAQGATAFRYPEAGGQPSSTLRVREISVPGSAPAPAAAAPVTDTPASVQAYQRCQRVGTRAATSNADMQGRIAQCLAELEARRQAGQ